MSGLQGSSRKKDGCRTSVLSADYGPVMGPDDALNVGFTLIICVE